MEKEHCDINYIGNFIKAVCEHKTIRIYSNDGNVDRTYIYASTYNVYYEQGFMYGCVKLNDFIGYWVDSIYNNTFKYEIMGD